MENIKLSTRALSNMALLLAMTVVLSALEHMLPPLPFVPPNVRLGLSNIVTMYTLFFMGRRYALAMAVMKAVFVLLMRGVTAGILSLCGGVCSVLMIMLLAMLAGDRLSYLILSIAGATVHNFAQTAAASVILKTNLMGIYWPVLLFSGVVFGSVTGVLLRVVMPVLGNFFKGKEK